MGRGQKRGRTQRRHFRQSRENVWKYDNKEGKQSDELNPTDYQTELNPIDDHTDPHPGSKADPSVNSSWQPFATKNSNFDDYYKEQGIVSIEEWDAFMACLRTPLPAAFRINASGQFFRDIKLQLENEFVTSLEAEMTNGSYGEAIRPLKWYPGNLAWHLNFSRMQLRKNQMLERFHEFLKQENEIGNITRQEAVSMVPPLFLNVFPGHAVLDMCAAPGSKTFQLLEMMHQSAEVGSLPSGLVIANDVDVQRCNLLIHQTKRMCSANLIVTNHEAQHFPSCHLRSSISESVRTDNADHIVESRDILTQGSGVGDSSLLFDRVLCDVPCSGDGTLRKAPDIWRKWHSGMGNGLHVLQVHIAMRGLSLLKVGGRMVYSTCSMNPIENEAVVSEVLSRCGAAVELLDVSKELPDLICRPGLRKWKVRDKGLWLSSFDDVPTNRRSTILPSMFPHGQRLTSKRPCNDKSFAESSPAHDGTDKFFPVMKGGNDDISAENSHKNLTNNLLSLVTSEDTSSMDSSRPSILADINSYEMENISCHPLERCRRIVPHDQNSGAFFIAVLQKVSSMQIIPEKQNLDRHSDSKRNRTSHPETENKLERNGATEHISDQSPDEAGSDANVACRQNHFQTKDGEKNPGVNGDVKEKEVAKAFEVSPGLMTLNKAAKVETQMQGKWKGIDPVVFFDNYEAIDSIQDFYGISPSFPLSGNLVSRNEDASRVKRIYYISKSVHNILKLNFNLGQRLKIASLGLKMFERQTSKDGSSPCAFRISSEGLPLLLPHLTKQVLHASLIDFQRLLKYRNVKFAELSKPDVGEKASKLILGCCVVVLNEGNGCSDVPLMGESAIAIVCWRGRTSLSVMVSEMDGRELLERISFRFEIKNSPISGVDESCDGVQAKNTSHLMDIPTDLMEVDPDK